MRALGVYLGGLGACAVVACGAAQPIEDPEAEGQGGGGAQEGAGGSATEQSTGARSNRSAGSGGTESSRGGSGAESSGAASGTGGGWTVAAGGAWVGVGGVWIAAGGAWVGVGGGWTTAPGGTGGARTVATGGISIQGTGGAWTVATGGGWTVAAGGAPTPGTGGAIVVPRTGGAAGGPVFYGGWTAAGGTPAVGGYAGSSGGSVIVTEWPAGCSPMSHSSGPEYCDVELECANNWVWVYCDMWESDPWCECESDWEGTWQTYEFTGVPDIDPCVLVANLCLGRAESVFTEAPECTPSWAELGSDWCDMEQQCTQSAAISTDVSITTSEWQYTWCELYDDVWTCSCNGGRGNLSFDYPEPVAASEVCTNASELCSAGATEIGAPTECTPSSLWSGPDSCDAEHDCTGAATIAGTEIPVHQTMYTNCYAEAEGLWFCNCDLGSKNLSIELSSPDSWTTCQSAAASCIEAMHAEASG